MSYTTPGGYQVMAYDDIAPGAWAAAQMQPEVIAARHDLYAAIDAHDQAGARAAEDRYYRRRDAAIRERRALHGARAASAPAGTSSAPAGTSSGKGASQRGKGGR